MKEECHEILKQYADMVFLGVQIFHSPKKHSFSVKPPIRTEYWTIPK